MYFFQLFYRNSGLIATITFGLTIVVTGWLTPNYSHMGQYISELGAQGAPFALFMNWLGIIPFGGLIMMFAIYFYNVEDSFWIKWFVGGGLFLCGLGFLAAGYYPCDNGCSFDNMSKSQIIHNFSAMIAFMIAILVSIIYGIFQFVRMWPVHRFTGLVKGGGLFGLGMIASLYGMILVGHDSENIGLLQRSFVINFFIWLIVVNQEKKTGSKNS